MYKDQNTSSFSKKQISPTFDGKSGAKPPGHSETDEFASLAAKSSRNILPSLIWEERGSASRCCGTAVKRPVNSILFPNVPGVLIKFSPIMLSSREEQPEQMYSICPGSDEKPPKGCLIILFYVVDDGYGVV